MRWKGFFGLLTVLFLLAALSTLVLAETSEVSLTPIKNQITLTGEAYFRLNITNKAEVKQSYKIYGLEVAWSVDPEEKVLSLNPGETKSTIIKVKPLLNFKSAAYNVNLYVDSVVGQGEISFVENFKKEMGITIFPEKPASYLPTLKTSVDMADKINPKEPVLIKLYIENRNPLDLSSLKVRVQSEMPEFNQELAVNLLPLDKQVAEFTITPNPFQQPKDYTLLFVFEHQGETVKILDKKIVIIPLINPFVVDTLSDRFIFKDSRQVNIRNDGNVLNTQEVKIPLSLWEWAFARKGDALVKKEVVEDKTQRYLTWELQLGPDEKIVKNYAISYRPVMYLIIVLILFGIFYFSVQPPVSIRKKAQIVKSAEEGSLSEVKVMLEVRNKSKAPLNDILVTDTIPEIVSLEKSLETGTLRPDSIKHVRQGTKICWSLSELDGQEHRVLSYRVRAKLNILGAFSLPRASVEFSKKNGREGKAYSNIFVVGNVPKEEPKKVQAGN